MYSFLFSFSLEHVFAILKNAAVKKGELVPKIIYEDKERPWVVKPPGVTPENGKLNLRFDILKSSGLKYIHLKICMMIKILSVFFSVRYS